MLSVAPARRFSSADIGWDLSEHYLARRRSQGPVRAAQAPERVQVSVVKIKEIVARVEDLRVAFLPEQAVVQATVVEQIFFVGPDGIVRERVASTPFSHRLSVPGLDPGRIARGEQVFDVTADVAFVLAHLIDEARVKDKIVVSLSWTLTERTPGAVVESGQEQVLVVAVKEFPVIVISPVEIRVFQVITRQLLLVERKPLEAIKIKKAEARVEGVAVEALPGRVIVSGRVRKQIEFVGPDGIVRGVEEELPFSEAVAVPGLQPGQAFEVGAAVEFLVTELDAVRGVLTQKIVLVVRFFAPGELVTVIGDVRGPGIVTERVLVRTNGVEVFVVTDVRGPGVKDVVKRTVFVDVVDDGDPNPVPLTVVVDLRVDP